MSCSWKKIWIKFWAYSTQGEIFSTVAVTFCPNTGKNNFLCHRKLQCLYREQNAWRLKFGSERKSPLKKWKFGESQCMVIVLWPAENCHYTFAHYLYSSQCSEPRQDALKRSNLQVTKLRNLSENHLLKWKDHSPRHRNELHSTAALLFCQPQLQHSVCMSWATATPLHNWYWNLII